MAGTDRIYVGNPNSDSMKCDRDKLWADFNMPVTSLLFTTAATSILTGKGAKASVEVPAGAYVYRVGIRAKVALASADVDVGDGLDQDRYIDGLTTLAIGNSAYGPVPNTAAATGVTVSGHYYAAADTVDAFVVATGATGSLYLDVWYTLVNTPAA